MMKRDECELQYYLKQNIGFTLDYVLLRHDGLSLYPICYHHTSGYSGAIEQACD